MKNPHKDDELTYYTRRACYREGVAFRELLIPRLFWGDSQLWSFLLYIAGLQTEFRVWRRRWGYAQPAPKKAQYVGKRRKAEAAQVLPQKAGPKHIKVTPFRVHFWRTAAWVFSFIFEVDYGSTSRTSLA